jgi:hypothetical protein
MSWNQDEHDAIAQTLEDIRFRCACGDSDVQLINLDVDDMLNWLVRKTPIYHMGMLGCCEKLRCRGCDNFPDHCECLPGAYVPWGDE